MTSVLKPWLILAVIFFAGVATGTALTMALSQHFQHPPGNSDMRERWMAALTRRLDLTADQQSKIRPIIEEASANIDTLHHEEIQKGAQIFKDVDDKIAAILTPEQKVKLDKMVAEREARFSGRMHGWGSGHDGPGHHPGAPDDGGPPPPPPNP